MNFLLTLFKILLLVVGSLSIVGGTLGSLCGVIVSDGGIFIGGAVVALLGLGLVIGMSRALKKTRAEAAANLAEMVARDETGDGGAGEAGRPSRPDGAGQ